MSKVEKKNVHFLQKLLGYSWIINPPLSGRDGISRPAIISQPKREGNAIYAQPEILNIFVE